MIIDAFGGEYEPRYMYAGAQVWNWSGISVEHLYGAPTIVGAEFALSSERTHYALSNDRPHYSVPEE